MQWMPICSAKIPIILLNMTQRIERYDIIKCTSSVFKNFGPPTGRGVHFTMYFCESGCICFESSKFVEPFIFLDKKQLT